MSYNRRDFLGALFTIIPFAPLISSCQKESISTTTTTSTCETTKDILGPFYRENSPSRIELNIHNKEGEKLTIQGTVYKDDCVTPISNAKIEIWHANHQGEYDNETDDFEFRGTVYSNEEGKYDFSTIVPGRYLNGSNYRPSHIHFKVTEKDHQDLVTQLYFEGDPYIESDPWASNKIAEGRIISLNNNQGTFDINLQA